MKIKIVNNIKLLIATVFLALFLTGCWDREELNTIAISGAIGIDKANDEVKLIMEVYNPSASGGKSMKQEETAKYIQSSGQSFFDAIRNITMIFDKKIFFAHTKALIISEEAARDGIVDLLDLWVRQHQPWPNTYILISKDVPPSEIIGVKSGIEDTTANYIDDLINNSKNTGKSVQTTVTEFLRNFYDRGSAVVSFIEKEEKAKALGMNNTEYQLKAKGAAVFSGQKLVGSLDDIEVRAMNFARGKIENSVIVSPSPDGEGINSIEVLKADRKISAYIEEDEILFNLSIKIIGILGEETGKIDTDKNLEILKDIASQNSKVVKKEVEDVIKKAQEELKTDIFGFDSAIHSKYPEQWKNIKDDWHNIFSTSEIRVTVNTDIRSIGLLSSPLEKGR